MCDNKKFFLPVMTRKETLHAVLSTHNDGATYHKFSLAKFLQRQTRRKISI